MHLSQTDVEECGRTRQDDQDEGTCCSCHRDEPPSSGAQKGNKSNEKKKQEKKIQYTRQTGISALFLQGYSMQKTGEMGRDRGNGQRQGRAPLLISAVSLPYGVLPFLTLGYSSEPFFSSFLFGGGAIRGPQSHWPNAAGIIHGLPHAISILHIPPSGPRGKPRPDGTLVPRDWSWLLFSFCFPCSLLEPLD